MGTTYFPTRAGAFGADTIIDLFNSTPSAVSALELIASMTTSTPASEATRWTVKVLKAGAQVSALIVHGNGITVPAGDGTTAGVTIGTQPIYDDGTSLRLTSRAHFWSPDAILLNPNTATNAGFYLDTGQGGGIHVSASGVTAIRAGSADRIFASATGVSFLAVTTPIARQTITGSRGGNAALASLLTAAAAFGLVLDSTTA